MNSNNIMEGFKESNHLREEELDKFYLQIKM